MNAALQQPVESTPINRFVDNGDGTITDPTTGLMWSQRTLCDEEINHETAARICSDLRLAGHADWRLPTVEELFALADRSRETPAIDTTAFPDTKNAWYWTSTITAWSSVCAWVVGFNLGGAGGNHRDYNGAFVRAVRSLPAGQ